MEPLCIPYAFFMHPLCIPYGFLMAPLWHPYGPLMEPLWDLCVFLPSSQIQSWCRECPLHPRPHRLGAGGGSAQRDALLPSTRGRRPSAGPGGVRGICLRGRVDHAALLPLVAPILLPGHALYEVGWVGLYVWVGGGLEWVGLGLGEVFGVGCCGDGARLILGRDVSERNGSTTMCENFASNFFGL